MIDYFMLTLYLENVLNILNNTKDNSQIMIIN